jgi:two-component system, OmpR family, heavy metal sensor histidine kinase CusS
MRSIRLSLMLYFLTLLAVALGAVSLLAYRSAHQTLLAKKETNRELIQTQYLERCSKEDAKLNDQLLGEAKTLAALFKVQIDFPQLQLLQYRPLHSLGVISATAMPEGHLLAPVWVAEGAKSPVSFEWFYRPLIKSEIKVPEEELSQKVHGPVVAEYYQINTISGLTYRSPSLLQKEFAFDFNPEVFTHEPPIDWEFDDTHLDSGLPVRRVRFWTPAARRTGPWLMPVYRGGRDSPPPAPRTEPRPPHPEPRPEPPARPAIYIQCACDTNKRDAALAQFAVSRDEELARLEAETNDSLAGLRWRLLAISLVTFAATAAGGLWLVRLGLLPLQRLSVAVSRVSEKDFRLQFDERRLPGELTPIVERLTQTFDLLKRAFAREKQAAADISHELRTPLAALLTTTEVALRKSRTPEEYRELLEDCRESGKQMSRLVERLLTLARLDAGVDTLRPQAVDVANLAEQCVSLVRPLAEARDLKLSLQQDGPAPMTADPDKLREVLTNLLHNAIQYNNPRGSVAVKVGRSNGHLEMEVRDTGIGIGPEARKHIFERFYRADPSRQADGLNAGLGLAIVKGYVDLMGGTITVESVEGEGSTFRIQLPAA